jgi:ankyrin repeat protein
MCVAGSCHHLTAFTPSFRFFGLQMLQQGCQVNCCDYDGRTGLMLAAGKGNTPVVKQLLLAGAVVNASDNMGGSALLEACKGGHDDTIW